METNARITKLTAYHQILAFKVWDTETNKRVLGHAACVFKVSASGPVFIYDEESGSVALPVTEWNPYLIQGAINRVFAGSSIHKIVYDVEVLR